MTKRGALGGGSNIALTSQKQDTPLQNRLQQPSSNGFAFNNNNISSSSNPTATTTATAAAPGVPGTGGGGSSQFEMTSPLQPFLFNNSYLMQYQSMLQNYHYFYKQLQTSNYLNQLLRGGGYHGGSVRPAADG